ncbi:MAG TPA: hypothetical protein VFK02_29775 [Kofleriaceae bacterium]|nr:hypothetical protein [Kofleriaceae bacterium]
MTGSGEPGEPGAQGGKSAEPRGARPGKPGKPDKERGDRGDRSRTAGRVEIELEVSRRRSAAWTIFGLVVGGLLIWKLGTVAVWGGIALVATGTYHAWNLIQTFLYAPGTIIISDREVSLPRGLCMPRPVVAKPEEVTAAYFLRRSVPWNHAAPVLIIELGARALAFPRDWFASEADQRHVIHALLRDRARAAEPA